MDEIFNELHEWNCMAKYVVRGSGDFIVATVQVYLDGIIVVWMWIRNQGISKDIS